MTRGQAAYEAFGRETGAKAPWDVLHPKARKAWEAAGNAAHALVTADDPGFVPPPPDGPEGQSGQ